MKVLMALAWLAVAAAISANESAVRPFSALAAGDLLPPGWKAVTLPRIKPADISLVTEGGASVLRVRSEAAAGTAAFRLQDPAPADSTLAWRWKVDRVVEKADLAQRGGDDFAARVYVFFDVPVESLSWGERAKLGLARLLHGDDVPVAGICYVWDNRHAVGTIHPNPYAPRVRTFVLESGAGRAGQWIPERRHLERDFVAAFGATAAVPRVTGIAAGNDTDQTQESATAWFGDFELGDAR